MSEDVNRMLLKAFSHLFGESEKCNRRFCFILGSGASRAAGIPTGVEMARIWAEELKNKYEEKELKELQQKMGIESIEPNSKNYFGLYELRYYPDYREGHAYFERELEKGAPSLGHHALAKILANETHNLAITTNFDSLIEDTLFIYTDKRPLVVGHESLTEFINLNISRPVIAKIHRSLYFQPFNRQDETVGLAEGWQDTIKNAFKVYTPVVIGYAGGDHSLMDFIEDEDTKMNGLYWCYWNKEEPLDETIDLVKRKNGCLIPIDGFDQMMFMLSRTLKFENPESAMQDVTKMRIERYNDQYKEFAERILESNKNTADSNTSEVAKEVSAYNMQLLEDYNKAIEMNPNSAEAYSKRGIVYGRLKEYEKAMEDYNKAIELDPKSLVTYNYRGLVLKKLKEYDKALADYNKAIELEPNFSSAYFNRGCVYKEMKQDEKALAEFNKVIELQPKYSAAYNNRGYIYLEQKKYDEALSDFNKAIEIDPQLCNPYKHKAIIYYEIEEYAKAMLWIDKAIQLNQNYKEAYKLRARIYKVLGEDEKAADVEAKAKELTKIDD